MLKFERLRNDLNAIEIAKSRVRVPYGAPKRKYPSSDGYFCFLVTDVMEGDQDRKGKQGRLRLIY